MRTSGILVQALTAVSTLAAVTHAYNFDGDYEDYALSRRGLYDDDFESYLDARDFDDDYSYSGGLDRRTLDFVAENFHLVPRIVSSKPFNNKVTNVDRVKSAKLVGMKEGATGPGEFVNNLMGGRAGAHLAGARAEAQQKGFIQQQNHRDGMRSKVDSMLDINSKNTWV